MNTIMLHPDFQKRLPAGDPFDYLMQLSGVVKRRDGCHRAGVTVFEHAAFFDQCIRGFSKLFSARSRKVTDRTAKFGRPRPF